MYADVEVIGDVKAVAELDKLGLRGADCRPVAPEVRAIYLESNKRQFDGAKGWPELADSTLAWKAAMGKPPIPEVSTGALRNSLTSELRVKGQKNRANKSYFVFGSTLFYAPWQTGTKHQPERKLIDLTPTERLAMATIIARYVAHGEAGLLIP